MELSGTQATDTMSASINSKIELRGTSRNVISRNRGEKSREAELSLGTVESGRKIISIKEKYPNVRQPSE